jgi:hypothetical protein
VLFQTYKHSLRTGDRVIMEPTLDEALRDLSENLETSAQPGGVHAPLPKAALDRARVEQAEAQQEIRSSVCWLPRLDKWR